MTPAAPLVYKYLCTQILAQAYAFVPMEANDGQIYVSRYAKIARVNFAIEFAFYVTGGRLARFSLFVSLWWQGRNHNEKERANGHKICFQMSRIWYRRKQERTRCCGFTVMTNLML